MTPIIIIAFGVGALWGTGGTLTYALMRDVKRINRS